MIDDCMNRESKLTDWETVFIHSVVDQLEDGDTLTPKQCDKLEAIWDRITSR